LPAFDSTEHIGRLDTKASCLNSAVERNELTDVLSFSFLRFTCFFLWKSRLERSEEVSRKNQENKDEEMSTGDAEMSDRFFVIYLIIEEPMWLNHQRDY
jgi:hypothetical protein